MNHDDAERESKRRRTASVLESAPACGSPEPASLSRPISPPPGNTSKKIPTINSPFQLTLIRDLPASSNRDVVSLGDLLSDPMIAECWEFNYLHDIDFLMKHFDQDTRDLVKVHVVHGFWKREDGNLHGLQQQAAAYGNVELHVAPMPEMFGTHHSKMMILTRHDDLAQVIVHTANMIAKDWTNMTNAVWKSPLLPLLADGDPMLPSVGSLEREFGGTDGFGTFGSGQRFKLDLLRYLRTYDSRRVTLKPLVEKMLKYDFSSIRATFIASVPGRHKSGSGSTRTAWGWPGLKRALQNVPSADGRSEVVVQVSSIATLGATDNWLHKCLFDSLSCTSDSLSSVNTNKPNFKVVFPTADEIRRSLDGYASGGSIHTKIQSPQQAKQLVYMRPVFCHWANDAPEGKDVTIQDAGRQRAAPHIKTYIRYGENSIDWALMTSANISKQAWGEAVNGSQEVRIASWETGVLVWPSLLAGHDKANMVGTFKTDTPSPEDVEAAQGPVIGLRIPYNRPLQSYGDNEIPWVATMPHEIPDCMGRTWQTA